MDGTLVDTEPYWFAAERDLVDRYGHGDWPDARPRDVRFDLRDSAAYMQEHGVIARLQRSTAWGPGARELLADLDEAGGPCALVAMSCAEPPHRRPGPHVPPDGT